MRPAFSVIFLTTLIGSGQGMFVALYCAEIFGWVGRENTVYFAGGSLISLILLTTGLAASFFHLGRPERAWRAATMWRTSWLSREVITLPLVMLALIMYALAHYVSGPSSGVYMLSTVIGGIGILLVLSLFVCTGMIYACIKFLQEWATPLTLINFLLLGLMSGCLLSTAWTAYYDLPAARVMLILSLCLLVSAMIFKLASFRRNKHIRPTSTIQTAIGIRHNIINQQAVGFMGGSFNTRAFFHGKSDLVIRNIVKLVIGLVFLVPSVLLLIGMFRTDYRMIAAAFIVQFAGLILERWHFFADSRHPQNLYYQTDRN